MKYSIAETIDGKNEVAVLELILDEIDPNLVQNNSKELQEERTMVKMRLDSLYKAKSRGYQIRQELNGWNWVKTSSSFFCNFEKGRQSSNCMSSLKVKHRHVEVSDHDILNVAHKCSS